MPKPAAIRQRRNKAATRALMLVEEQPRMRAPSLPKLTKTRKVKGELVETVMEWHPMARQFWAAVWASPMHHEFLRADEPALFRLVLLVHQFWSKGGSLAMAAEIRMLEREFGLTPLSRRRLEWTVAQAEEAKDRHEEKRIKRAEVVDLDPRGVLDA